MMSRSKFDTRERILRSAWKLLEDGAGNAVRMTDIAKQASVSRQAVYLHFPKRADLLIAANRFLDEVNDIDARLEKSRKSQSGLERLDAFIEVWCNYIPEIYGVAKAQLAMKDHDEEVDLAWNDRMQAVRHGCEAAVVALKNDGLLSTELTSTQATDLLWTLLSVRNWEQLRIDCKWSQSKYLKTMKASAMAMLTRHDP